jgi:hypothetical protein
MIRVVIEDDVITVPEPVAAIVHIVWGDGEIKTAEPETGRPTAGEPPYVVRANCLGKVTVLPRVVEMIVRIARTGVVADPVVIFGMNMRSGRMTLLIREGTVF